jgi:hypothetical protein
MRFGMPIVITCSLIFGMALASAAAPAETVQIFAEADIPIIDLKGQKSDILSYKYLGSWSLKLKRDWKNTWKDFIKIDVVAESRALKLTLFADPLPGALPKLLTPDTESAHFKAISWQDNQVTAFAFCGVSAKVQTAILELDTDTRIAIYNNSEFIKEVQPVETIESGALLYVPVLLKKGSNIFVIKILSNSQSPRIRASMVLDQSRDFQAAWSASWGFLGKNIYPIGKAMEPPSLKWDASLDRLTVSAEVRDCLMGEIVSKKDKLRNGSVIRDGSDYLREGLYEISYNDNRSGAREYFIVGSPRIAFEKLKDSLLNQSLDENEKINIEAQIRRGEILLDRKNYDADNPEWQEKVVYTLASLANFVGMMKDGSKNLSKNVPGLHIRGFVSQIDHSKQFYRLFVPSTYTPERDIPLLLIMPTPVSARNKPFIESPFMASHRQAVQISTYAEKHGFAVAWPGYRNPPDGWSYESAHGDEVIKAIERNYNIDKTRVSIYGICGGGFFAGRLVAKYPERFAAIVYDRAYFGSDVKAMTIAGTGNRNAKSYIEFHNHQNRKQ